MGYHTALVYYWLIIVTFFISPQIAYQFMELLEAHAVDTYSAFLNENGGQLKLMKASDVAVKYYLEAERYAFQNADKTSDTSVLIRRCI